MATYYIAANGNDCNNGLSQNAPWKTIEKVNNTIMGGDTVCFRCGDSFFGHIKPPRENSTPIFTTYTSYGDGPKPVVSEYKTANPDAWKSCENGVWCLDLKDTNKFTGNITELDTNVGFLKVDGKIIPHKCFELKELSNPWDFYSDDRYVYVKTDVCPSSLANDIKFACNIHCMKFADNLSVENIVFMGTGAHGIQGTVHNASIKNCEFHEIGGSILTSFPISNIRYGNGIECWTDSSNVLIENCRFSGIYDVAFTMQGNNVKRGWENITFRGNVIWNCQQSFEIWSKGGLPNTGFKNCVFENNICIDSGYCWGYDVRPNKAPSCHLLMYALECPLCDITIRNNTFHRARVSPIFKKGSDFSITFKAEEDLVGPEYIPADYKIINNTFFIEPNQNIVFCNTRNEAYDSFFKKLALKNNIIESTFQ